LPTAEDGGTTVAVVRSGAEVSAASAVALPVSIAIPDINLTSSLVPVGTLADGSVDVPADPSIAGWFSPGPRPGERGPAVIMGHVDSLTGPGVFFHLAELSIGSTVTVTSADGPRSFVVQAVERFPKDTFPTARVYGAVPEPALRLITCGGTFDRSTGHYRDNVIVFLAQVAV
jgi:sortase (surface protein transpeptidase)